MRVPELRASWVFHGSAALMAAAAMDPIVERMSNSGVFGPGSFTDHSNVDVLPALCVGLSLCVLAVALFVRRTITGAEYPPMWLREYANFLRARSLMRMLPSIFVLQLVALFAMETLEQFAVGGRILGPMIWLGGPIAASLLLHSVSCVVATWTLATLVRRSARVIVRIVRAAFAFLRKLFAPVAKAKLCDRFSAPARFIKPFLRRRLGRAPPIPSFVQP